MFEDDFLELMPHTVNIYQYTGQDEDTRPIHNPVPLTLRARITGKILSLRRFEKEDTTVVFDVYVKSGDNVITTRDKLELPNDAVWVKGFPVIFAVARISDEDGHHHTKLQCGWMYHRQGQ